MNYVGRNTVLYLVLISILLLGFSAIPTASAEPLDPQPWEKSEFNPIVDLGVPGSWDDAGVFWPTVIFENGIYKMWYTGTNGTLPWKIGYATSTDGLTWTKYSGNPVMDAGATDTWDDDAVAAPIVINDNGVYKMWYQGLDFPYWRIGYAVSNDGINWVKHNTNPVLDLGPAGSWDDFYVSVPKVVYDGSTYKMWYTGNDYPYYRIGMATSPDGISWTKYSGNPVLSGPLVRWSGVTGGSVIFDGEDYHLWYSLDNTTGPGGPVEIWYAVSSDGVSWINYYNEPVLEVGDAGDWDDTVLKVPHIMIEFGSVKMWYSGHDGSYNKIGYASFFDSTLAVTSFISEIEELPDTAFINSHYKNAFLQKLEAISRSNNDPTEGTVNKLENDILPKIDTWINDDYSNERQNLKKGTIDLIKYLREH